MKTTRISQIGLILFIVISFLSCASNKTIAKNIDAQSIKERIDNKQYTIDVNRMVPVGGQSRHLTSNYSLTIEGNTVISHLPYFGQAYSVPYGGGKGLIFEAPITVYTISYDERESAEISFQTRSEDDVYRFSIQIFDNGSASIQVNPNNRQAIHFYGNLNISND